MLAFFPPNASLRPLEPASHGRWLDEVRAHPPLSLTRDQQWALAGLLYELVAPAAPYQDDPAGPSQREGIAHPPPPDHHAGTVRLPRVPWDFEAPQCDEWALACAAAEDLWFPWYFDHVDVAWVDDAREPPREAPPGSVMVTVGESVFYVGPHYAVLAYDMDIDPDLVSAFHELTGWVSCDTEQRRAFGIPVVCPACRHLGALPLPYDADEPAPCEACGADLYRVRALPHIALAASPRRKLDVLAALGAVEHGAPSAELVDAVEQAASGPALSEVLLRDPAVVEVYATDDDLQAFLDAW